MHCYWANAVDVTSSGTPSRIRVHELYWGDKSRYSLGWISHIVSFARLILGLPWLATFGAHGCRPYQLVVRTIGLLLIARSLVVLVALWIASMLGALDSVNHYVFWMDLGVNVSLLVFALGTFFWSKRLTAAGINPSLARACIAVSFFVLESIPYAFYPVETATLSSPGTIADWLYAPNTLVGIWPYLEYWFI
jgi:hypothetical protein